MPTKTPITPIKFSSLLSKAIHTNIAKRIGAIQGVNNHFEQALTKASSNLDEAITGILSKQFELLSKDYISGTKDKRQYVLIHLWIIWSKLTP